MLKTSILFYQNNILLKNCRRIWMVEKEKAEEIMAKYNRNFGTFTKNATRKEFKTVLKYVAEEANRKQRKLVGLDK